MALAPLTLTVDEAANELRVSKRTVWKLIADQDLKSIKVGRRRLITRAALEEYLDTLSKTA